jgi:hypothetical protein
MKFEIKNRWTGDVQFECARMTAYARFVHNLRLGYCPLIARLLARQGMSPALDRSATR